MPVKFWESVLADALHSVRSLLCTSTNSTPHERLFNFQRKSSTGSSIPSWLTNPGRVLIKNFNRQSKFDPLVEEVELVEANPEYAHIRYPSGRESTISLRHLAPITGEGSRPSQEGSNETPPNDISNIFTPVHTVENPTSIPETAQYESSTNNNLEQDTDSRGALTEPRGSARSRRPPSYLKDYVLN